jgi:EmrB/QacA subfamily drug resistance transporter
MSSTEALFARYGPAYRWIATVTAMIAAIAVILSATIVNVAIPDVMGAFGISQVEAQWLSTGFLAAMTATMLLTAWAEHAFGQRDSIVAALALFMGGSVLGGVAPDETVLIVARVLQGSAAGIVQPLAMIIVFQVFPPDRRGSAMGIFGIGVVLAPALGPWVGGLLMDSFNWRWVFYLGVPFAALAMALASVFLPTRNPAEPRPGFDWLGFGLLCLFLTTLLSALSNGQRWGWNSDPILLQFALAVLAAIAFVWWERLTTRPMLDLRLFGRLPFASAAVVSFIMGAGLFGSTYLLPVFVQTIQGMTPTEAGLLLMPAGFVLVIVFPLAGRLTDRMRPGLLIGAGMLIFAWSSWLMAQVDVNTARLLAPGLVDGAEPDRAWPGLPGALRRVPACAAARPCGAGIGCGEFYPSARRRLRGQPSGGRARAPHHVPRRHVDRDPDPRQRHDHRVPEAGRRLRPAGPSAA